MFTETTLSCPLCGNTWTFVHTWKTEPVIGACEACDTHFSPGISPRNMIEHRRPKTLFDVRPVPERERQANKAGDAKR